MRRSESKKSGNSIPRDDDSRGIQATACDVAIIGAGPAGSAAAILLARAGWSVALIEKRAFPRRKVCGECLAASNLPLLAALGVGPAFAADAGPGLRRVALMRGERTLIADLPPAGGPDETHRWGRALGRETLDTLLRDAASAAGAKLFQPWAVHAIDGEPGHWRLALKAANDAASDRLSASVIIDAHGSWEALPLASIGGEQQRQSRQSRQRHLASDLLAFKANYDAASLQPGLLPVLAFPGGYGGMVVEGNGVTTLACCIRRDRLERLRLQRPGIPAGETVEAMLIEQCEGVRQALRGAKRRGGWLAVGPIAAAFGDGPDCRRAGESGRFANGIFRVGNAAGEAHPILGEGMSMALQSAFLLCSALMTAKHGTAIPDATAQRAIGRRYAATWQRHFAARRRLAAVFAHAAMRPMLSLPLFFLCRLWPGLLTLGARWGGKVRCAVGRNELERLQNLFLPLPTPSIEESL